jgi:hypothetical protein
MDDRFGHTHQAMVKIAHFIFPLLPQYLGFQPFAKYRTILFAPSCSLAFNDFEDDLALPTLKRHSTTSDLADCRIISKDNGELAL